MSEEIKKVLLAMGNEAKKSSQKLALASAEQKNKSLHYMADNIDQNVSNILDANNKDIARAKENNISQSFLDRLILNEERIKSMSDGLRSIASLEDPIGQKMAKWQRHECVVVHSLVACVPVQEVPVFNRFWFEQFKFRW